MNFIVSTGEVDNVINIMEEVTSWGRCVGLNVWKDEHLTREKLILDNGGAFALFEMKIE
ncbi:hypothetical protein [Clostridium sp.]|uniref:hypothetical protein n=1 Tax=Clostridium sp. TaxID=1506 RepID=UPI003217ED3B